jgi:hypothetical protein
MASSSIVTPKVETSLEIYGNKDFKNHSKRNSGGIIELNHPLPSPPLLNVIRDMGFFVLPKCRK